MSEALRAWLEAFLFSQAFEVPIYTLALSRWAPRRALWLTLFIAFGATALTHPVVWFVFPRLVPQPYWLMGVLAEAFAVGAEAVYMYCFGLRGPWRAFGVSFLANAASCGLGLLSRSLWDWP